MKNIIINEKEYKIMDLLNEMILSTHSLDNDLAIVVKSRSLNKVGLGRNLDKDQLIKFFHELNPNIIEELGLFEVKLIGGNDKGDSVTSFNQLIENLEFIDAGRDIINIQALDVCEKIHPNSFQVNCYHGGITALQD